ncbi:acyl-CoA-binding protein [Cunninghamella echinulata]|nr:acyl-CoA-binding protein [Cunninghamella echinulata]
MSSTSYETQFQFSRALKVVRSMPINSRWQPPVNDKLQLYGLYKQATEGDCTVPKPSSRDIVRLAKWKAWDQLRHLSPVEAQKQYIILVIDLITDVSEIIY